MCFVKINNKKTVIIHYRYFAVLYRSFVNIFKQSHVTSNKSPHNIKVTNPLKLQSKRKLRLKTMRIKYHVESCL